MKRMNNFDFFIEVAKQNIVWFFTHPKFKTFLWQTANGFLTVAIVILGEIDWVYMPVILAVLNYTTKAINTRL